MALTKRNYIDKQTVITAQNLNDIQDNIIQNAVDIGFKYEKPADGIPENDLSVEVQEKLNDKSGSDVTADTVRGWGFAYQSEIPNTDALEKYIVSVDNGLGDVLMGSGLISAHGKALEQGSLSTQDGRKLTSTSAEYTKRVRTKNMYAYGAAQTFVCAEGLKLRMLYYGDAENVGSTTDTSKYTNKFTEWTRTITFPPLVYVGFVVKADDNSEITVEDVTSKIFKYTPLTPVTDQHIIDVVNAAYPAAEGVGF